MSQPQHVIVTGAAGALGRAVVEHFLNQGAHVHALDISDELLAAAMSDADPGRVHSYAVDLTSRSDCMRYCVMLPAVL